VAELPSVDDTPDTLLRAKQQEIADLKLALVSCRAALTMPPTSPLETMTPEQLFAETVLARYACTPAFKDAIRKTKVVIQEWETATGGGLTYGWEPRCVLNTISPKAAIHEFVHSFWWQVLRMNLPFLTGWLSLYLDVANGRVAAPDKTRRFAKIQLYGAQADPPSIASGSVDADWPGLFLPANTPEQILAKFTASSPATFDGNTFIGGNDGADIDHMVTSFCSFCQFQYRSGERAAPPSMWSLLARMSTGYLPTSPEYGDDIK